MEAFEEPGAWKPGKHFVAGFIGDICKAHSTCLASVWSLNSDWLYLKPAPSTLRAGENPRMCKFASILFPTSL
jgi:hypothetical protein